MTKIEDTYSKYEFFNYIINKYPVLLHGSGNTRLDFIKPVASASQGKILYATAHALQAMAFALRDSDVLCENPIYTGCFDIYKDKKSSCPALLSIAKEVYLSQGMIYVLPGDMFSYLSLDSRVDSLTRGKIKNRHASHYISKESVKPLFKIQVTEKDLPISYTLHMRGESFPVMLITKYLLPQMPGRLKKGL